ncbi:MAG: hypothetical protein CSA81_02065 [Acidobacteria bacterium]|nr:MAG: hypothetical protein CSA81_02065 [Acidobacteriota bacterium]
MKQLKSNYCTIVIALGFISFFSCKFEKEFVLGELIFNEHQVKWGYRHIPHEGSYDVGCLFLIDGIDRELWLSEILQGAQIQKIFSIIQYNDLLFIVTEEITLYGTPSRIAVLNSKLELHEVINGLKIPIKVDVNKEEGHLSIHGLTDLGLDKEKTIVIDMTTCLIIE